MRANGAPAHVTIRNEGYEVVPIDRIARHPKNPRKGDLGGIAKSITKNGFYGAVVVQQTTGYILAGNHRFEAMKREGATEIPVVWANVDDKTARRILLADNKTADDAGYDDEALARLLEEVRNEDTFQGTGYVEEDLDKLLEDMGDRVLDTAPKMEGLVFRVVVECDGETHQADVLARLEADGLRCKPLIS